MASSWSPKMCFRDVDWSAWVGPKPAPFRRRTLALRLPLSPLPVAGLDLRVLRLLPVGFSLNHRLPAMTFISSSKRYHRVGHQMVPPLLRFSAFAPLSVLSCASTPTTPVRPWFRRLDANPAVSFRPCGFTPLRRFTPHKSSEGIALQCRKGFVAFRDPRSLSARPRRNVFTLWIETIFSFPATQLPLEVYPHRQPCRVAAAVALLELLDADGMFQHKAFLSSLRSMSSWPTKSPSQASTRVAQSLLSRFHGRMSAASLGRSPSRLCSIGEFGFSSPRCRVEKSPFLPWVLVLFQVPQHVSMPAVRRVPFGTHRVTNMAFPPRYAPPESLL